MRVHHLNCISSCPFGGVLMDGRSRSLRGRLSCHCLLVETGSELVLVDSGLGLRDVADPRGRLSRFLLALLSPELREEMTAARQVARLGFDPADVGHVVLTHLDFDHAGGLDDFPRATVHMLAGERAAALEQRTVMDRMRYRPQQWSSEARWRDLDGVPPEILLVPLVGHTHGHAGVAVRGPAGWLLQAGDAYFWHEEMDARRPRCTPGLRFYQWMLEKNRRARFWNQQRLRDLRRSYGDEVTVFSAHDPLEFQRLSGHAMDQPASQLPLVAPAGEPPFPP